MTTKTLKGLITKAVNGNKSALRSLSVRLPECTPDGAEVMMIVKPLANAYGLRGWTARDTWADVAARWSKILAGKAEENE